MKPKGETLGQRIYRIRGKTKQAEFGKRIGVSQGAVSAWERDDKDRLPSADTYFRLAVLAPLDSDKAFFLQKAGLSRETIVSAANELIGDQVVHPRESDVVLIQPLGQNTEGTAGQRPPLRVTANIAPNPTTTRYLAVNKEEFVGQQVYSSFPGNSVDYSAFYNSKFGAEETGASMHSPLELGDIIFVDISESGAVDFSPFWGRLILVGSEERSAPKYLIGQLGLMPTRGLVFTASLHIWTTSEHEPYEIGMWRGELPASAHGRDPLLSGEEEVFQEALARARKEIRLDPQYRILGLVVGWHRPPSKER